MVRDWAAGLAPLRTRAIYLSGAHDPVFRANSMVAAMHGRANVDVRVLSDAGLLLIYERPDAVFEALEEILARRAG